MWTNTDELHIWMSDGVSSTIYEMGWERDKITPSRLCHRQQTQTAIEHIVVLQIWWYIIIDQMLWRCALLQLYTSQHIKLTHWLCHRQQTQTAIEHIVVLQIWWFIIIHQMLWRSDAVLYFNFTPANTLSWLIKSFMRLKCVSLLLMFVQWSGESGFCHMNISANMILCRQQRS